MGRRGYRCDGCASKRVVGAQPGEKGGVLWKWFPDAMLRNPKLSDIFGMPCACEESEVEII